MQAQQLIQSQEDAFGLIVCLYQEDDAYVVGTRQGTRCVPLQAARFWTFESAAARFQHEIQERAARRSSV